MLDDQDRVNRMIEKIGSRVEKALKDVPCGAAILRPEQAALPEVPEDAAIARLIDHTLLRAEYTPSDVDRVCDEAIEFGFATVCTNPVFVPQVVRRLQGTTTLPASVVGFIFGAEFPAIKAAQARKLIDAGADEMDVVIMVGLLKAGEYVDVARDLQGVIETCHDAGAILKVILEVGLLTQEEKIAGALIAQHVGADYVKTCTGFAAGEATVDDIRLLRRVAGAGMGVKAAGGVRSYEKAVALLRAGASRLGATQSVKIAEGGRHHG
jgi:deoxyribose-phosphate aldolase